MYDAGTLTPLQRPQAYGDNFFLSPDQAKKIADQAAAFNKRANSASDPNQLRRPKERVGGYNMFWIDRGQRLFRSTESSAPRF